MNQVDGMIKLIDKGEEESPSKKTEVPNVFAKSKGSEGKMVTSLFKDLKNKDQDVSNFNTSAKMMKTIPTVK